MTRGRAVPRPASPKSRLEIVTALREILADRLMLIQQLLKVPYDNAVVPLTLRPVQREYLESKTHSDIILKSRQLGMTTIVTADYFLDAVTIPHLNVLSIAENDKTAETIVMPKYALFYDLLPEVVNVRGVEVWIKPKLDGDSRALMYFSTVNQQAHESRIRVGTAGSMATGRGESIHRFHGTEVAFWPPGTAAAALAGIEGSMQQGGTRRVLESTANGTDSFFWDFWERSRRGETGYKCFFFPWFRDPTAALARTSAEAAEAGLDKFSLTEREARLKLQYNLSMDQMRWYRLRCMRMGKLADQEVACDDITCFLVSGKGVFDPLVIMHYAAQMREPIEETDGLRTWLPPAAAESYLIAVDPAPGVTTESDYSVAVVINPKTLEHCTTLRGRWDSRTFAQRIAELGYTYNGAPIAVERNVGEAVTLVLSNYLGYPNLFRDENGELGWRTTKDNKGFMVDALKVLVNSRNLITYDGELVSELRSFTEKRNQRTGNIKIGAEHGKHDDIVMAMALACTVRSMSGVLGGTVVLSYL